MNDQPPPPPVPADCDLKGLDFMPLEVKRLASSDLASQESPEACWAAVLLWCESWQQVPAAGLSDNDVSLARYAGYGRDVKRWMKVRSGALRGWRKCSDDRLYHPVVAEKALEAWLERLAQRLSSGEGNAKRWGMAFDRSKVDAAMEKARQMLASLNPNSRALSKRRTARIVHDSNRESQDESHDDSQYESRRDRKGQRQRQGQLSDVVLEATSPPRPVDPIPGDLPTCPPAREVRRYTVGDLAASHGALLCHRSEDRDQAATLLALYGWEATSATIRRLEPEAKVRPPGKQRILVSELTSALERAYELEGEDYLRAGLPVPAHLAKEPSHAPA